MNYYDLPTEIPIVFGDNFACLVALCGFAHQGQEVLHVTSGGPLGGHFAGIEIDNDYFDFGMVLAEISQPRKQNWVDYQVCDPVGWLSISGPIHDWCCQQSSFVSVPILALIDSKLVPDFLIADQLDSLASLTGPIGISTQYKSHPSKKHSDPYFVNATYLEASRAIHGERFHEKLIAPWLRKLTGSEEAEGLVARYHRVVWAPLYYPDTLHSASRSEKHALANYKFSSPSEGNLACWVRRIDDVLASKPNIKKTSFDDLQDPDFILSAALDPQRACLLGLDFNKVAAAVDLPPPPRPDSHISVGIAFGLLEIAPTEAASKMVVNLVDEAFSAYRFTVQAVVQNASTTSLKFSLEFGPASEILQDRKLLELELERLAEILGFDVISIELRKTMIAKNAVTVPTREHLAALSRYVRVFREKLGDRVSFTASWLGFSRSSMNDQIAQGLSFSRGFYE